MTIVLPGKAIVILISWGIVILTSAVFGATVAPLAKDEVGCLLACMAFTAFIITVCALLMI